MDEKNVIESGEELEEKETPSASPAEKEPEGGEEPAEKEEGAEPEPPETEEKPEEAEEPEPEAEEGDIEAEALRRQKEKLLSEITELRKERREIRTGKLIAEQEPKKAEKEPEADLSDLDPEWVEAFEKVAKAKGYVRKDEFEREITHKSLNAAKDAWLEKHPELKPENDLKDAKWGLLMEEYRLYRPPATPKDVEKVLDRAYRDAFGQKPRKPDVNIAEKKEKAKDLSRGSAAGSGGTAPSISSFPQEKLNMLQGYTDEEKVEILSELEKRKQ